MEIKFRGKRLDNGYWAYGQLFYTGDRAFIIGKYTLNEVQIPGKKHTEDIVVRGWIEVDPTTVGQYIGIKNKSGMKIYAGDVCKNGDWVEDAKAWNYRTEIVEWDCGNGMWVGFNHNSNGMSCEIIGNIHEHKYLLDAKTRN